MAGRSAMAHRVSSQRRCGAISIAMPNGPKRRSNSSKRAFATNLCLHRSQTCLVMALLGSREAKLERRGRERPDNKSRGKGPASEKRNNDNGGRTRTKPARHLPQLCPQEQDSPHHLPGKRGEA